MRVLLVEDEEIIAAGISMLLEAHGVTVDVAYTGREAIPAVERFQPDVVILDVGLPDMSGIEVYREMEKRRSTPVLFSSGHVDASMVARELTQSNVAFLAKPYDFETLMGQLARLSPSAV